MSEVVNITGGYSGTIYGTFNAALAHMQTHFGSTYAAFLGLSTDDQKRALITVAAFLDQLAWNDDADTFAERDAIAAFVDASYELGALLAQDDAALTAAEQGSELQSVSDGGVSVTFRDTKTRRGSSGVLPPNVARLIGKYLVTGVAPDVTLDSVSSAATNPFSDDEDYDRTEPF